jgi:prophage maintenance system killer protein
MSKAPAGMAYPEYEQAVAFHHALMERLEITDAEEPNEQKLRQALDRARTLGGAQRGDLVMTACALMFELIKSEAYGKYSMQGGMALTLAFLLRHGAAVNTEDDELVGVAYAIAEGKVFVGMLDQWLRSTLSAVR